MEEKEFSEEQIENLKKIFSKKPDDLEKLLGIDSAKIKKTWSSWEGFKVYSELLNWSVRQKFNTLSVMSALAATLLVVATFNSELIELNNVVRILLSILLLLIPVSLWALIYELHKAEIGAIEGMKESIEEIGGKFEKPKKSFRGFIPWIINLFLTGVIIFIIVLILQQMRH